jgi:hypothetical protein
VLVKEIQSQDPFHVSCIYEDSQRPVKPSSWYLGIGDWESRIEQWNQGKFQKEDGEVVFEWNADPDQNVRLQVTTGENVKIDTVPDRVNLSRQTDADGEARGGYLNKETDWRNLEMTCYLYLYDINGNDNLGWYTRGGRQGNTHTCQSCKYQINLHYTSGDFSINKKLKHHNDNHRYREQEPKKFNIPEGIVGNVVGRWFGLKAIVYNLPVVGKYPGTLYPVFPVKMEVWIDDLDDQQDPKTVTPKNNWKKRMETIDNPLDEKYGIWGSLKSCQSEGSRAKWPRGMTLSWGSPSVTFRADRNSGDNPYYHFLMKYASIREIQPERLII